MLRLYNLTEGELEKIIGNRETIFWERHIARIILKGVAKGDHISLGFLSDYIFGAMPKEYKVNATVAAKVQVVTPEQTLASLKKLNEEF